MRCAGRELERRSVTNVREGLQKRNELCFYQREFSTRSRIGSGSATSNATLSNTIRRTNTRLRCIASIHVRPAPVQRGPPARLFYRQEPVAG